MQSRILNSTDGCDETICIWYSFYITMLLFFLLNLNKIFIYRFSIGNSKTDRQTQLAVDSRTAELYNSILHF
jgi:hypothetical protein